MNKYESVIIINPDLKEKSKEIITKYQSFINKQGGNVEKIDDLGIKKLAYEIKGNKEGYYVVFYFETSIEIISELERLYKIDEDILKFICIKTN